MLNNLTRWRLAELASQASIELPDIVEHSLNQPTRRKCFTAALAGVHGVIDYLLADYQCFQAVVTAKSSSFRSLNIIG